MRGNRGVRLGESDPLVWRALQRFRTSCTQPASDLVVPAGRTNVEASQMGGLIFAFARRIYGCCA
jgi:hypothetical protein